VDDSSVFEAENLIAKSAKSVVPSLILFAAFVVDRSVHLDN